MKKKIFILLMFVLLLCGCGNEETESSILRATLNKDSLIEECKIKDFNIQSITFNCTLSNGSSKTVNASLDMLSREDQAKLSQEGMHSLTINFNNKEYNINLTLLGEGKYTVTFYNYDGDAFNKKTYNEGKLEEVVSAQEVLEVENYLFDNWYLDEYYQITYQNDLKENVNLYSRYVLETETFTVKFYDCLGKLIETKKVNAGESVTAPTPTEIKNKKFIGWDKTEKEMSRIFNDMIVTANYEDNKTVQYAVTMQTLGLDQNQTSVSEVNSGETFNLPTSFYGYENYIFNGWFYDSEFTEAVGESIVVTKDITIYGSFTKK